MRPILIVKNKGCKMELSELSFHQINPFDEINKTKQIWLSIEAKANNSFYLSWSWMENWLNCLDSRQNIVFVYATNHNLPVFCYFLGLQSRFERKIIYARRAYLNQTGDRQLDCITIEHNGILIDQSFEQTNFTDVFQKSKLWDELVAKFIMVDQVRYFKQNTDKLNYRTEEEDKAFYIDLNKVRENQNDLLNLLSKNKRSQIKRSIKAYEKESPISLKFASNVTEALEFFTNLIELHQERWTNKGEVGSFSSLFLKKFHQKLITHYFNDGNIDLINIYSGDSLIGCLYNFRSNDNVYFYQSGFKYRQENVYRPGLVCHLLAVNHYASAGFQKYDLLVGEMEYKKSLSSECYLMPSYRLRKHLQRFKFEDYLRAKKPKNKNP